jgi:CrcB protein
MKAILPYVWVGLGGFLGANARFLVGRASAAIFGLTFPFGTLIINLTGSFLLGLFATLATHRWATFAQEIRFIVSIGFIGAYTTFSTFEYESHSLFQDGKWLTATIYIVASIVVGLLAVRLGILLADKLAPNPS